VCMHVCAHVVCAWCGQINRDGRMTVRVVMRYLVNKLSLEDDSQVCHAYLAPCLFYFILFLHSFALSLCFFFMFVFFE
jgi:hypothetical protein